MPERISPRPLESRFCCVGVCVMGRSTLSKLSLCGIAVIAALMLSGGSVRALDGNYNTANTVMPGCRLALLPTASNDPFDQGFCMGLVYGITFNSGDACSIPPSVTRAQAVRAVVQYIDAQPAKMHESFAKLADAAITATWPCMP
ncbi:Rap1a/Tai family immunity protein [Bradyrhizobium sp. JYMT SZCCT0428]|uniref:Rap1a/Tai family immunity protein n=1 Tax=Bradyrhizobium sp. JYMT SZCCT0428 TaxID=2807673 RepID=UPI003908BAA9